MKTSITTSANHTYTIEAVFSEEMLVGFIIDCAWGKPFKALNDSHIRRAGYPLELVQAAEVFEYRWEKELPLSFAA